MRYDFEVTDASDDPLCDFLVDDAALPFKIRNATPADAPEYVAYLKRNWSRFRSAMPTETGDTFSVEHHERRIGRLTNARPGEGIALFLVDRANDERIVGDINFSNIVHGPFRACHVGFKVDEEFEGRGMMEKALSVCCEMMFRRIGMHRIMANYRPENRRSAALLKRVGFEIEGLARDYLHLDGDWRDHVLTSLVARV